MTTAVEHQTRIKVENLFLSFGGVKALSDVSLDIKEKEITAIIGPNGAGKTCLLNCISGFYKPQSGKILFEGKNIARIRPDKAAQLGFARTFQNIELYSGLSTLDNLMAARHIHMKQNAIAGAAFFGQAHHEEIRHRRIVEDIIDFLEMESIRKKVVGSLPYGMRKRVELGRALAMEPKVL
ncbi:MAG TPA: ATP-binding cassette domain-containing protein, partial [Dehalococcoidales bacterium]|nr:ATP-binding cassette domain-containing protein [Dehalococcoidales bacterium]